MLDVAKLVAELDRNTKVARKKKAVEVAGKKVELATTNPDRDAAVEDLGEAKELLKRAILEHTPLFKAESSYILKCHTGDELFPCANADVCNLCKRPEKVKEGVVPRGHHLDDDPAVWVCDRYGHPKVVGCRCPKCTTEQGCKYFYYWEPGAGFPVIGKEKKRNVWLPATTGYDKGIRVEGKGRHKELVHYTMQKLLPVGMYEEAPPHTDIGTCRECLYWDRRLQCPAHVAGDSYWVLKRHYPLHLEWSIATYKHRWQGDEAPMLLPQREHLSDAGKTKDARQVDELLDRKLQKERIQHSLQSEAPPDTGEGRTYCDLDKHLQETVRAVSDEWKQVMKNKGRTPVLKGAK